MIFGKRLRAPDSSLGGQWGKWITVMIFIAFFCILHGQQSKIYAAYQTEATEYGTTLTIDPTDKDLYRTLGDPEYDASTGIWRVRVDFSWTTTPSGGQSGGLLIQEIFNNSNMWYTVDGKKLYVNSDDSQTATRATAKNYPSRNPFKFTFQGTEHTATGSVFTNPISGVWWTSQLTATGHQTQYGYIYFGNVPSGQTIQFKISPEYAYGFYATYIYTSWNAGNTSGFINLSTHTHNQDGRDYDQGDEYNHITYKYCNGHGDDHGQNRDGGTWESHSWYATSSWYNGGSVEKQDQRCSTCGRTRTMTRNHTYNDNWAYEGRPTNTSYARHNVYHYYTCTTCDSRYDATPTSRYAEDCYDANNDGKCDFCGRQRVLVNINVLTPEGDKDTSGQTATFNAEWYDNTDFCLIQEQQKHTAGPVADQPYDKVWVGTTITISNITMKQSYLYLSGVTGTTQNGSTYTYTVNSAGTINIKTAYKSYNLTINPNGGTLNVTDGSIKKNTNGTATATVTYNSQSYYNLGVTASRTHYIMDGFYTSASGGTKLWDNGGTCYAGNGYWNSNNKWCYAGDVTVYAHWKDEPGYHNGVPIVYTITYTLYPQTGKGNIDIAFKPNVKLETTYTIETKTFEVPSLEDTSGNYSFEGWYGSCSSGSKNVTIKQGSIGDLHFEADWLPTKDLSKGDGHDQNLPYVKTTEIKENKVKIAA